MQMSEKEIVRSYTNAKDKRSQVGVLAELNACPNDTIREILERNGISAPKPGRKSKKKEEPKKPKAQLTEKAKRLLRTEEPKQPGAVPDDPGKKAERLIKTDETKKSENRQLKIEHSDQEDDLNINFDACAWAYSMDDYDSDTLIFASEEMNKAKEQIAAMEQDIRKKKLEISTLKCKVKYLNLWLMHRGWRDDRVES